MDVKYKRILLEILDDIVRVCKENNISYFLLGGSMLGAVRHNGIIPWDDDIDIGMPRSDYEKFIKIASECLSSNFKLVSYRNDKKYQYFFAKVYHQQTTLVEFEDPFYIGGVYIDVFPIDGLPNSKYLRSLHYSLFSKFNSLGWISLTKNYTSTNIVKRIFINIVRCFPSGLFYNMRDFLAKLYRFDNSKFVGNLGGAWGEKEFTLRKNFSDVTTWQFEGRELNIPVGYKTILTEMYGDYMQLPPIEKRKSHHSHFFLNLDRRYSKREILDYKSGH